MIIRHTIATDLEQLTRIEAASYPQAEGASKESIRNRMEAFPECFWILEEEAKILAFINGMSTNEENLTDDMYDDAKKHNPVGKWQMIFSVVTDPVYCKRGYASKVMAELIGDCKNRHKSGVVLTCKEQLLPFYSKFGFVNEGISESTHGNVKWYQMRLVF